MAADGICRSRAVAGGLTGGVGGGVGALEKAKPMPSLNGDAEIERKRRREGGVAKAKLERTLYSRTKTHAGGFCQTRAAIFNFSFFSSIVGAVGVGGGGGGGGGACGAAGS